MKKVGLILALMVLALGFGFAFDCLWFKSFRRESGEGRQTSLGVSLEPSPIAESVPLCTRYTNEEYGFSLCYPLEWALPEEEEISPPQQHLYQIILNPKEESYSVDIYDQPAPVSLGSFVRDYFKDMDGGVSWTNEAEIKGQEVLQFFLPRTGLMPAGVGGTAFRKGHYILTLTTPEKQLPGGDFKEMVNEEILNQLAESFEWVER